LRQNHENPSSPIIILLGNIMGSIVFMASGNKIMKKPSKEPYNIVR
jgi:hypothetical protein